MECWTTGEGYKALGVALADVDLRVGGLIRSRYSAGGVLGDEETVENRILAFEPRRMIAILIERTLITLTEVGKDQTHPADVCTAMFLLTSCF